MRLTIAEMRGQRRWMGLMLLFLWTASSNASRTSSTVVTGHPHLGGENTRPNVVTFPLIPHHVEYERRRRERRALSKAEDDVLSPSPRRREEAQQVGALYQGYGTHYVDLWCGTPPQRQTVIVDTGSGVTAFPCSGCKDCGVPDYHIDRLFVEDESSTFEPLTCDSQDDCNAERSRCSSHTCAITMSYAEGSRWTAYEATDRCYVAGPHETPLMVTSQQAATSHVGNFDVWNPNHAADLAFDLVFGCQSVVTGLFKTQLADGIMGMSNSHSTYWRQMFDAKKMGDSKAFSLCFSRQPLAEREGTEAGALTLGGVDERLHTSPMVYTPGTTDGARSGFFNVRIRRVMLREGRAGESAQSTLKNPNDGVIVLDVSQKVLNTGGVIVDSGTTDTYWNRGILDEFNRVFQHISGRQHSNKAMALTEEELHELPTVLFQLASELEHTNPLIKDPFHTPGMAGALDPDHPYDVILAFPPTHYLEYDPGTEKYTSRFYPTESRGSVLGANAMMGHDILFDIDNNRLGWAESNCDYTSLVKENGYAFDITGELQDARDAGASPPAECESFKSGSKCQSHEGCAWYFGKCKNNGDAPPPTNPPAEAPAANAAPTEGPDVEPPHNNGAETVIPPKEDSEDDDDVISNFVEECRTPACRYPVAFALLIALLTGCCLSCCFFRFCMRDRSSERHQYARASTDGADVEMTTTNGDGSVHSGKSFRDDPGERPSTNGSSSNGSYRDEPESPFSDEPEFEGDFA